MKNCFTICVDMDDTIENLLPSWLIWLNEKYRKDVKFEDIRDWDLREAYPDLSVEQLTEPLNSKRFWRTVTPKLDAVEYLQKLIEEDHQDVYICTNSHYETLPAKFTEVIKKYFPYLSWKDFIVIKNKQMIKCDIMIDDYPQNLIGGTYKKILIDAPYNKSFDADKEDIFRVSSWKEIYELVHHLDWIYSCEKKQTINY